MAVDLKSFILGLLFMIAASIAVLNLVFDMYGSEGYDIDLTNDSSTAYLATYQEKVLAAQSQSDAAQQDIWNKTPGQNDAALSSGSVTEGDMIATSLRVLTSVGDYVDIFLSLMRSFFSSVGINNGPAAWFILIAIITTVAFIIINSLLRSNV